MPTIELSQETFDFLQALITEINTQDNRATAHPYYFTIASTEEIIGLDDGFADTYVWVKEGGDEIGDDKDLIEYVKENLKELLEDHTLEAEVVVMLDSLGVFVLSDFWDNKVDIDTLEIPTTDLEEIATTMDIVRYGIKKQTVYKGFFLTESAAEGHLNANRHHYGENAHTYIEHAFRNPELEKLLKSVGEIVGIPYAKK
jgi:acyl carrier protein